MKLSVFLLLIASAAAFDACGLAASKSYVFDDIHDGACFRVGTPQFLYTSGKRRVSNKWNLTR